MKKPTKKAAAKPAAKAAPKTKAAKKASAKRQPAGSRFTVNKGFPAADRRKFAALGAAAAATPAGKQKSTAAIAAAAKNADDARQAEATALKRKETLTPKERARLLELAPRPADTRWPSEILIGERVRKDFGDITLLARSINERGILIHRIPVDAREGAGQDKLIAGERRLRAWTSPTCQFRDLPIPVNAVRIDSIAHGEWDENDPALRKDFTPEEMVKLKRVLEPELKVAAAERSRAGKKTDKPGATGRTADIVGRMAGKSGRTVEKAEKIVEAAEKHPNDPRRQKLVEDMNRTGRVNGPAKRLTIIEQTEQLRQAPPPLPMKGPYGAVLIDYPWPQEPGADQEHIDAHARSLRPYAAMSIEAGCKLFASEEFQALLADDCVVWFCTTNFHMPYAYQLLQAMGFTLLEIPTILTWTKDKLGRGQILRDKTEHVLVAIRGKPVINLTNQSTHLDAKRPPRNSQKPDELYALVEDLCPASRYADIFSGGGRGEKWDCHGEPGRMAVGNARAAGAAEALSQKPADVATVIADEHERAAAAGLIEVGDGAKVAAEFVTKGELIVAAVKAGHTISHTLDHTVDPSDSVATCHCGGFVHRQPWKGGDEAVIHAAIEAHWREVLTASPAATETAGFADSAPSAATSPSDVTGPKHIRLKYRQRVPADVRKIGAATNWSNPYADHPDPVARRQMFLDHYNNYDSRRSAWMRDNIQTLRGRDLACTCAPDADCGCCADVLIELANAPPVEAQPGPAPITEPAEPADRMPIATSIEEVPAPLDTPPAANDDGMDIPAFLKRDQGAA